MVKDVTWVWKYWQWKKSNVLLAYSSYDGHLLWARRDGADYGMGLEGRAQTGWGCFPILTDHFIGDWRPTWLSQIWGGFYHLYLTFFIRESLLNHILTHSPSTNWPRVNMISWTCLSRPSIPLLKVTVCSKRKGEWLGGRRRLGMEVELGRVRGWK